MIYLLLAIIIHTYIFVCFQLFRKFKIDVFTAVVVNYSACVAAGLAYNLNNNLNLQFDSIGSWWYYSVILGGIFISTFQIMAQNTQVNGVSTAAISAKTSMIIPIIYSAFLIKQTSLTSFNIIGLMAAFASVFLSGKSSNLTTSNKSWFLIIGTFLGSGLVDLMINVTSHHFKHENFEHQFSILSFIFAAIFGLLYGYSKGIIKLNKKNIVAGMALGIPNYFSILFIYKALGEMNHNGTLIFPLLNIGTILLSSLLSLILFKEQLTMRNLAGIVTALIGLFLLTF